MLGPVFCANLRDLPRIFHPYSRIGRLLSWLLWVGGYAKRHPGWAVGLLVSAGLVSASWLGGGSAAAAWLIGWLLVGGLQMLLVRAVCGRLRVTVAVALETLTPLLAVLLMGELVWRHLDGLGRVWALAGLVAAVIALGRRAARALRADAADEIRNWELHDRLASDPLRLSVAGQGLIVKKKTVQGETRNCIVTSLGRAVTLGPLTVDAAGAELRFGVGVDELAPFQEALVMAEVSDGSSTDAAVAFRLRPGLKQADRTWKDFRVDCSRYAGKTVTVRVASRHLAGSRRARVCWADPAWHPMPTAPLARRSAPPIVLLLVFDCCRPDFLSEGRTPHLDALVEENALLFEQAVSQGDWTYPSFASIMTGLYPSRHKCVASRPQAWHSKLPADRPVLSELLRAAGYRTFAWTAYESAGQGYGFARGFDRFVFRRNNGNPRHGDEVSRAAIDALERHPDEPLFLLLHYFTTHRPFYLERSNDVRFVPRGTGAYNYEEDYRGSLAAFDAESQAFIRGLYAGAVAQLDESVGLLTCFLRATGRLERTTVIATADHGIELFEHGRYGPKGSSDHQTLHVPLLIRYPGRCPIPRTRIAVPVEASVSILPTILDLCGIPYDAEAYDGQSLAYARRAWERDGAVARAEIIDTGKARYAVALYQGGWKYVLHTRLDLATGYLARSPERDERFLYHVQTDPLERENLVQRNGTVARALSDGAEAFVARLGRVVELPSP